MIELRVNGQTYGGWKDARVSRGVDQAAGEFSFTASEKFPGQSVARDVRNGDACTVLVNGQVVITGYVDDVEPEYEKDRHEVRISGRSKTADLVDCSAEHSSGQWSGQPLQRIAEALIKPFGIGLVINAPTGGAIPDFQLQQGETVFDALKRLCAMRALLVSDDARGNLVITRTGSTRASGQIRFKLGSTEQRNRNNVLRSSCQFSWRDRFSRYIIKGQSAGTDDWFGEKASGVRAEVSDGDIGRYRPLIVIAETQVGGSSAAERAAWEMRTRRGKGLIATYTVQDWVQDTDGNLWTPNTIVPVDDDYNQVRGSLLVAGCSYEIGQGSVTKLRLCPPEAYDVLREAGEGKGYTAKWADLRGPG